MVGLGEFNSRENRNLDLAMGQTDLDPVLFRKGYLGFVFWGGGGRNLFVSLKKPTSKTGKVWWMP